MIYLKHIILDKVHFYAVAANHCQTLPPEKITGAFVFLDFPNEKLNANLTARYCDNKYIYYKLDNIKTLSDSDAIIFVSDDEYYNWLKNKYLQDMTKNNSKNRFDEFENYAKNKLNELCDNNENVTLFDILGTLTSAITDKLNDEEQLKPNKPENKKPSCSCQSDLFNTEKTNTKKTYNSATYKSFYASISAGESIETVSSLDGKYKINNTEVPEDVFNKAVNVIESTGSIVSKVDAIHDIETTYLKYISIKKKEKETRKNELLEQLAKIQAEIEKLDD